jgi:hypothetical protein
VNRKLFVQGFEGRQASGTLTMWCGLYNVNHPLGVPVLKVHHFSYCSLFTETEPAL